MSRPGVRPLPARPPAGTPRLAVASRAVASPAGGADSLADLAYEISLCRACPRLVAWRELVAAQRRAAYRDQVYWGRPVPGFGDPAATIMVVGLAPAAHGGNRTGRVFTGDRSGDWLFAALYRAGLASQPTSTHPGDGLRLEGVYVAAAVRCAPPANRPTPEERDRCLPFLTREMDALPAVRVVVVLGHFAYDVVARFLGVRPRPRFGHGAEVTAPGGAVILCSFHPSQQNTFTGRLTEAMLDAVLNRARALASGAAANPR